MCYQIYSAEPLLLQYGRTRKRQIKFVPNGQMRLIVLLFVWINQIVGNRMDKIVYGLHQIVGGQKSSKTPGSVWHKIECLACKLLVNAM